MWNSILAQSLDVKPAKMAPASGGFRIPQNVHGKLLLACLLCFCQTIGGRQVDGSNYSATIKKSELIYENQNLSKIPVAGMCNSSRDEDQTVNINVVNLAYNQIKIIEPDTFTCVALYLKILILSHNQIGHISDGAFNSLESVQVL